MSASLVGSEMCIRDRGPRSRWPRPTKPHTSQAGDKPRPRLPPRHIPVSYTHLTLPTICSV
eukprot:13342215-Alexandrium_andersonii.AAC.1